MQLLIFAEASLLAGTQPISNDQIHCATGPHAICALSHGNSSNDLDGLLTRFHVYGSSEVEYLKKRCVLGTMLLKNTNRKL